MRPHIRFEVLDGFDARAALALDRPFTKIYIDMSGMSGYRSLLDVMALLTMYATVLRPEAIVVKSAALKHFAAHCFVWRGSRAAEIEKQECAGESEERDAQEEGADGQRAHFG
jgi:hypothetical protein